MQKNNLDETTNLLLNNEYSLNDNDEVDEEIEYKNIKKKKKTKKKKILLILKILFFLILLFVIFIFLFFINPYILLHSLTVSTCKAVTQI